MPESRAPRRVARPAADDFRLGAGGWHRVAGQRLSAGRAVKMHDFRPPAATGHQIQKFKANWVGTVNVKLRDGKNYAFTGFHHADRKAMPQVFEKSLEVYRERGFDPPVTQSRENLCTHCMNRVPKAEYTCGNCGATYWSPAELSLRSLLFPSWGDFLMGHWAFATVGC